MARTLVNTISKVDGVGTTSYVKKSEVDAPFTEIQNRAKVDNSMQALMGVERIHVNSLNKLAKEFGPNGEPVFEPDNGDARVRFIGEWSTVFDANGMRASVVDAGQGVEVTFYGTGINLLTFNDNAGSNAFSLKVDGVADNNVVFEGSTILQGRNYKSNITLPMTNGLALGWHTVLLETTAADGYMIYGFEILNEASQITVKEGTAFSNGTEITVADSLLDYNLGFENVADIDVGTKGGRAVIYAELDGTVKKRLTKVDVTPQYLTSTDHTNESVYRRINFREFGRNRADDFSTLVGSISDRAFTLDDGTTTLVGNDVLVQNDSLVHSNITDSWTLTFVGTGLAIVRRDNADVVSSQNNGVIVDGTDVGNLSTNGDASERVEEICSGLPYGTHTVKVFMRDTAAYSLGVKDFIVYQPKKPELPENVVEIAEYNIMADFVANTVQDIKQISTGILRKMATRELIYVGPAFQTNFDTQTLSSGYIGGIDVAASSGVINDYVEYTFFGTGFDYRFRSFTSRSSDITVTLNGQVLNTTNFPTMVDSVYGSGIAFNNSTGSLDQNSADQFGNGFVVSGLPLAKYTIRLTANTNDIIATSAIDIITPIHTPHTTFGSRSLKDLRNFDSNKSVNRESVYGLKAFASWRSTAVTKVSKGISQILKIGTGRYQLFYEEVFNRDEGYTNTFGGVTGNQETINLITAPDGVTTLPKHFVDVRTFNAASGAYSDRNHNVIELKGILEKDELEE